MIGERENTYSDTNYGALVMRPYDIEGNEINAFYDSSDNLIFVLDNTITAQKPNVLLVINPVVGKKWDEILAGDYGVDLETVRPKQDNKYQKLDIEYSGLNIYENLINAYKSGAGFDEELTQLNILRDSAARHSAMTRLNAANEIISKTNATIVKTKETIVRLQTRIKTLRANLSETKKEIGKVPTKQSASRVLKIESQIEATNEKLKRAQKRLESAQRRLEIATVDAELANNLLNQPASEIKHNVKNKPVMVAPKHEIATVEPDDDDEYDTDDDFDEDDDTDEDYEEESENVEQVKPLFNEDPQIINENIAFKPISFDSPALTEEKNDVPEIPVLNQDMFAQFAETPKEETSEYESYDDDDKDEIDNDDDEDYQEEMQEEQSENKPVLETMAPIMPVPDQFKEEYDEVAEEKPVLETMTPIAPVPTLDNTVAESEFKPRPLSAVSEYVPPRPPVLAPVSENIVPQSGKGKPSFVYYLLLIVLIVLSVLTLWVYQKNVNNTTPVIAAKIQETEEAEEPKIVKPDTLTKVDEDVVDEVFLDAPVQNEDEYDIAQDASDVTEENDNAEALQEPEPTEEQMQESVSEEVVENTAAPVVMDAVPARVTTSVTDESSSNVFPSEEEILANKPVYEAGPKYDEMFVNEQDDDAGYQEYYEYDDDMFYDEEEAAYQAEQDMYYEE